MVVFREAFSRDPSIHPSTPSSIHGWHHTGKKTLAEINNPPSAHVSLFRKGMPGPKEGHPQDFDILPSPIFYHGQLYVVISRVTSNANIKIFIGQGPDVYMQNVVYREVLEM